MSYFRAPSRFRLFMRKWGTSLLFVSSFIVVIGAPFALTRYVHMAIEDYASRVNGAQVTIRDFDLSLFSGTCRMEGVTIAHHTQVMRNILELDEVRITFERLPLLAFKLIVPNVHVEGVHYGTPRERSGTLESEDYTALPSTALLDRILPGAYDSVKASLGETPLRNLGQLTVGLSMRNSVAPHQQSLAIYQNITSIDSELDRALSEWEKENERISRLTSNSQDRTGQFSALRQRVNREAAALLERANRSFDSLPQDTEVILDKLGVPSLASQDFTREVLGRRTLNHLERIAYWIEMSRRKMGLPSPSSSLLAGRDPMPANSPKPRFLVRAVTIHSVAGSALHKGNVQGEIRNVASRPMGEPLTVDLHADFPGLKIMGVTMQASVDHSRPQPEETLDFKLDSYPLVDWAIEQTPDLTLAVARGTLKVSFHSLSEGASVSSKWTVALNDSALLIDSRFPPMERTLKETLIPLAPSIEVEGRLTGTNGKEVFEIQSAAGHELATVLAQRFATPLQNARATVQEEIHNRFMPQQKRLETRILNTTSRLDRRLADALETVVGRP